MSDRLARVIRRILRDGGKAGLTRVTAIVRPGEVRLEGRAECVLVAGNHTPAIGEMAAWARVDAGTLVTAHHLQLPRAVPRGAPSLRWEEVLISDQVTYGRQFDEPLALWEDAWGKWWFAGRPIIPNDPVMLVRGDFDTAGWPLMETLPQENGQVASIIGAGAKVWLLSYYPYGYPDGYYRYREGTINPGGGIAWGAEEEVPGGYHTVTRSHLIRSPDGHLWLYIVGGMVPRSFAVLRSTTADSLGAGWDLLFQSSAAYSSYLDGSLAAGPTGCLLLRHDDNEYAGNYRCYSRYSTDWAAEADTGFEGDSFRAGYGVGGWWLTWRHWTGPSRAELWWAPGGSEEVPVWGAAQLLAAASAGADAIPYLDEEWPGPMYCTDADELRAFTLPDHEEPEEMPRHYAGGWGETKMVQSQPGALAIAEGSTVLYQDRRVWAVRLVEG